MHSRVRRESSRSPLQRCSWPRTPLISLYSSLQILKLRGEHLKQEIARDRVDKNQESRGIPMSYVLKVMEELIGLLEIPPGQDHTQGSISITS